MLEIAVKEQLCEQPVFSQVFRKNMDVRQYWLV